MVETEPNFTRVIAVVLSEAQWRAFVALEPSPDEWIREQIRERVETGRSGNETEPAKTPQPA